MPRERGLVTARECRVRESAEGVLTGRAALGEHALDRLERVGRALPDALAVAPLVAPQGAPLEDLGPEGVGPAVHGLQIVDGAPAFAEEGARLALRHVDAERAVVVFGPELGCERGAVRGRAEQAARHGVGAVRREAHLAGPAAAVAAAGARKREPPGVPG